MSFFSLRQSGDGALKKWVAVAFSKRNCSPKMVGPLFQQTPLKRLKGTSHFGQILRNQIEQLNCCLKEAESQDSTLSPSLSSHGFLQTMPSGLFRVLSFWKQGSDQSKFQQRCVCFAMLELVGIAKPNPLLGTWNPTKRASG